MVRIAAVGSSEFIVGFQLAGIRDTIEVKSDPYLELKSVKGKKRVRHCHNG